MSQTLQILHAQLDNFRKYGPPKIPHIPLNKSVIEPSTDILHDKAYQHSDELNENSDGDVDPSVYDPVGLKVSAQQQFYPSVSGQLRVGKEKFDLPTCEGTIQCHSCSLAARISCDN